MKSIQRCRWCVQLAIGFFLIAITCTAQSRRTHDPAEDSLQQFLNKYPGLLPAFGNLFEKLQQNVQLPQPRDHSRILEVLPESTVFYAAFPNYAEAANQALTVFRQELQTSAPLREWSQRGEIAAAIPKTQDYIERFSRLAEYVGDEIVVSGSLNGKEYPDIFVIAEVRKPGLANALQQFVKDMPGDTPPPVHILEPRDLSTAKEAGPREFLVLIRPDMVIAGPNLKGLRDFNARLDRKTGGFSSTSFGQRVEQAYKGGTTMIAAANLQEILRQVPMKPEQARSFQNTGFADMKYLVWQHKGATGQTASEAELSFTGPRRGVASWLAEPARMGSLDYVSPGALVVASTILKNLDGVFDDIRAIASSSNPTAFASLAQMEQGMGLSLRNDVLGHLSGEITLELDSASEQQPVWKAILSVTDPDALQQTLSKLLAMAPVQARQFTESGITYHSLQVPSAARPVEVAYTFTEGYLIIGSGQDAVRQAIHAHQTGESLANSKRFTAVLPPGHSAEASALLYEDPLRMMGLRMRQFMPQMADVVSQLTIESNPAIICAYGDKTAIREASASNGVDAGVVLVAAAVAIPNILRAKISANEASAVASMQNLITAQAAYAASYPRKGYARDMASLGFDPHDIHTGSAEHAALIDPNLANANCTAGNWCEKSGYKFTFTAVCRNLPCKEFVVVSTPVASNSGTRNFCATSDGVVRFTMGVPLNAPIAASECRNWPPIR